MPGSSAATLPEDAGHVDEEEQALSQSGEVATAESVPPSLIGDADDGTSGLGSVVGGVERIVLVEDDDGDALLVEVLVEDTFGDTCDVVRARTAAEACQLVASQPLGLRWCALVDLGLPDAQGLEALEALRAVAPSAPLVVMTGTADDALGLRAVAAGAQDYLVKGRVEPSTLRRSVGYALERCRADEAARLLFEHNLLQEENARLERGLLPSPLLDRHVGVQWSARYRPGSDRLRIGGDFYDLVEHRGQLHLLVGDVCGHGPDEAALGVMLRVAWRTLVRAGLAPSEVLRQLDDLMRAEATTSGQFSTIASLRLDAGGAVGVTLAGHPPPLAIVEGTTRLLSTPPGPPLGVLIDAEWHEVTIDVPGPTTVLAYTDGLFEGRSRPGSSDRLGIEAVAELVTELHATGHRNEMLLERLMSEVTARNGGPIDDDIAVVQVDLASLEAERS